jgi:hypothetical protein
MQDNRRANTSNGSNRPRTTLVLLLAVDTLAAAGVAGTALFGRGASSATHAVVTGPQGQANDFARWPGPESASGTRSSSFVCAVTYSAGRLDGVRRAGMPATD